MEITKRIIAVVVAATITAAGDFAQTIKGKIVDSQSGEPIIGATIQIG